MSCKCQEQKTLERAAAPCADLNEESFRQAFLRESAKATRFAAERDSLAKLLDVTQSKAVEHLKRLDAILQKYAGFVNELLQGLDPAQRKMWEAERTARLPKPGELQ